MSHFTVLVIGDDVDGQLGRYNENTEVDAYPDPFTADAADRARAFYAKHPEHFEGDAASATDMEILSSYHDREVVEHGDGYAQMTTHNPDSKWDWYQIGGRWSGYFKCKPGVAAAVGNTGVFGTPAEPGWADQIRKGDVDFDGVRDARGLEAYQTHQKFIALVAGLPEVLYTWNDLLTRVDDESDSLTIDQARSLYNEQPRIKALATDYETFGVFNNYEDYDMPTEQYVENARNSAVSTYALVHNGEWFAKGEMGWFGMSSGDVDQAEWDAQFSKLLDGLDDDTVLTLIDCHI